MLQMSVVGRAAQLIEIYQNRNMICKFKIAGRRNEEEMLVSKNIQLKINHNAP